MHCTGEHASTRLPLPWWRETRRTASCSPRVSVVDASDARKCDDASIARRFDTARDRGVTVQRHVGTVLVVVARMRSDQPQQVAFTEHGDMVKHLAATCPHKPLRASICHGALGAIRDC